MEVRPDLPSFHTFISCLFRSDLTPLLCPRFAATLEATFSEQTHFYVSESINLTNHRKMGHKKRAVVASHRLSPANTPESPAPVPEVESAQLAIKQECERALNALRRGNHNKALRLMKESAQKYENSALIHRVSGTISVKVAGIIDDPNAKQRHLKNAIGSSKKAVSLSPNSIEFAHFYASLLFDVASDGKDYEEVVAECERALGIESPIDPAKENLLLQQSEDKASGGATSESRIAQAQHELRSLIQKSNIASISSWMKNLGGVGVGGDDKFRLIPLRRLSEDPLEVRYLQSVGSTARRPNEIKKVTKTPEERRKEIEVRVAAARLLQQKSEQGPSGDESKGGSGGNGSGSTVGAPSRAGERRRHANSRRNATISERKDQVRSFWNSMSSEIKRDLLRIKVSGIRAHFSRSSNKDGGQAYEILSDALAFGETNKRWKFWACFRCGERFPDAESHMQHVVQEHMGNLLPKIQPLLPPNVDSEWAEMLVTCSWKPLDLTASVRMLEDQSKHEDSEFSGLENHKGQIPDCWSDNFGSEEVWESLPENKSLVDSCNSDHKSLNVGYETCNSNVGSKVYSLPNSWPLLDDTERAKLLEKISCLFQMLVRHKCLATSHLHKVIQFTMEELQGLVPGSRILCCGLDQTPICICFLGAAQLRKIVKFLQDLCHACGVGRSPEKISPDDTGSRPQVPGCDERIMLNDDASCLLLDENLLLGDSFRDDVSSGSPVGSENIVQAGSDSLLSWIYAGPSSGEQLAAWSRIREEKSQQGMELLEYLEKEFGALQNLCDKKYEHSGYEEALQGLEELCLEESKKRERTTEFSHCSYDSILRKRRDELIEGESEVMFLSNRLEVEVISNILKEAENINANQFGFEETYGGVTSHLYDLEAGEDDWKSKDYLHQMDTCIEIAMQRQKEQVHLELSKIDAKMLRSVINMQQLEHKLEPVSAFDYRFILLPLVKSFLRAHLEDLAEKDATEKSDAAREAFLAELALDSRKSSGNGNDNLKNMQEKVKDKKRNKDFKRSRDSKAGSFSEQLEVAEQFSVTTVDDDDQIDTEMVVSDSCGVEELDDFRRKIELEAEERKLEETLEFQRRIENEAKQKLLAEQHRRNALAASEGGLEESGAAPLKPGISVTVYKHEPLASKNVSADNLIGPGRDLRDGTDDSVIADGMTNGGITNDEVLPFEERTGRKGRRRSSTKIPEGRYQAVSYGKEKANVECSTTDGLQRDQVWNQDGISHSGNGGSKTLRQLQAEEDEEERFQADLKKAVKQSLDSFQAHHKLPSKPRDAEKISHDLEKLGPMGGEVLVEDVNEMDVGGAGLQNEIGEYNCFLNVIIQSLWHLRRFREGFLKRSISEHVHVGDPCVVCALFDILSALSVAFGDSKREPVASTALRIALSNLYPESSFFQEGQMNDASEVLAVIFDCLHRSFTPDSAGSDCESVESSCLGSYDCTNPSCIAHTLFGMDIFERMNCYSCGLESRHLKYTSFFHNINASALRTMKVMCADNSFDELLNFVEMNHQLPCDPEAGGCGKLNHIHHILSKPPHVFTTVLGWQNAHESVDDIKATLTALETEIDISVLYRGLDPKNVHRLVSVVCYYGQHYHCFAYSRDHEKWIMYDDKTVKVIGTWEEVLCMCERGHLQPQVLFYEAVN